MKTVTIEVAKKHKDRTHEPPLPFLVIKLPQWMVNSAPDRKLVLEGAQAFCDTSQCSFAILAFQVSAGGGLDFVCDPWIQDSRWLIAQLMNGHLGELKFEKKEFAV